MLTRSPAVVSGAWLVHQWFAGERYECWSLGRHLLKFTLFEEGRERGDGGCLEDRA
jgi:hypothetical protein